MAWETYAPLKGPERRYFHAPLYAEIARGINARRAYIGHPLTEFSYLGSNPGDYALANAGGTWPRNIIAQLLGEFKDSIEWCAANSASKDGRTYFWVEPGPVPYGRTRRTTVDGDPNTITEWAKVVGCIREIIAGLNQIWALPQTPWTDFYSCEFAVNDHLRKNTLDWEMYQQPNARCVANFRRTANNLSTWLEWRYPGYPPGYWDYQNRLWDAHRGSQVFKLKNCWGDMEVPVTLRVFTRATSRTIDGFGEAVSISWSAGLSRLSAEQFANYKASIVAKTMPNPYTFDTGEILVTETCGSMSRAIYEFTLTTPPGEDIYLAAWADASIPDMDDWDYSLYLDPWPTSYQAMFYHAAYYYLRVDALDENGDLFGTGLNALGGVVPGMTW